MSSRCRADGSRRTPVLDLGNYGGHYGKLARATGVQYCKEILIAPHRSRVGLRLHSDSRIVQINAMP